MHESNNWFSVNAIYGKGFYLHLPALQCFLTSWVESATFWILMSCLYWHVIPQRHTAKHFLTPLLVPVCSVMAYLEVSSFACATACNKFAGNELCLPRTSTRISLFSSPLLEDCLVQQRMLLGTYKKTVAYRTLLIVYSDVHKLQRLYLQTDSI